MFKKIITVTTLALALFSGPVLAEWKPNGSITMITMFPPGGGGDILSRAVAKHFEDALGWNVVVENKPGGGGAAMAKILKTAPADGMTIGFAVSETFSFAPAMNPKIGYTADDFSFIGAVANTQVGWVAAGDSPYNSLEDLVAAAKDGAEIEVGVFSPRANAAVRAIGKHFGVEFIPVPIKSGNEGINNILNGHLDTTLVGGPQAPHVRKGRERGGGGWPRPPFVRATGAAISARHLGPQPRVAVAGASGTRPSWKSSQSIERQRRRAE